MPKITPLTMLVSIPQEKDVALICQVESDPYFMVIQLTNFIRSQRENKHNTRCTDSKQIRSILSSKKAGQRWKGTIIVLYLANTLIYII